MSFNIIVGDNRETLRTLPDQSVHCVVTSPPYFGLRDYGVDGQIGLEPTPDEFVAALVEVFREVRRVLRDDGTVWLNLGDSYASSPTGSDSKTSKLEGGKRTQHEGGKRPNKIVGGLKPKDLIGIPWRVAFALQADGWYLRQDIIWAKPNPMPESVRDRCTKAHEYIFLLSKSPRYFYDHEAIKEPAVTDDAKRWTDGGSEKQRGHGRRHAGFNGRYGERIMREGAPATRNKRSVWTVTTKPFKGAHFATFPPDLIEPCVLAGTSEHGVCRSCGAPWERIVEKPTRFEGGSGRAGRSTATAGWRPTCGCADNEPVPATVLDPFGGSGTTGLVAERHGRHSILLELNPEYAAMAEARILAARPVVKSTTDVEEQQYDFFREAAE